MKILKSRLPLIFNEMFFRIFLRTLEENEEVQKIEVVKEEKVVKTFSWQEDVKEYFKRNIEELKKIVEEDFSFRFILKEKEVNFRFFEFSFVEEEEYKELKKLVTEEKLKDFKSLEEDFLFLIDRKRVPEILLLTEKGDLIEEYNNFFDFLKENSLEEVKKKKYTILLTSIFERKGEMEDFSRCFEFRGEKIERVG